MLFIHYEKEFEDKRLALDLPSSPYFAKQWLNWNQPSRPQAPRWSVDWAVLFIDQMYFRIREQYEPFSMPRVAEAYRAAFSYHYGPNTGVAYGNKPRTENNDHTVIRIDKDVHGPHLCYQKQNHIQQGRVKNLNIEKCDLFEFIRAVIKVRQEGRPFHDVLGFEVEGQAVKR